MTLHRADDDSIAQYVAGTLPAAELEKFEQHLLTCAECRDAVRIGAATRVALTSSGGEAPVSLTAPRRRVPVFTGLAAAAAAVIAIWVVGRDSPLDRLGEITPAPFVAGALRPSADSVSALVDSAMTAYVASNFGDAARLLRRASRRDSSDAVFFFLGVSLLMQNDDSAAREALARVTSESAYGDEALYFAAKALVRLDRVDSAIAVLGQASGSSPAAATLRSFADSLRRR